ncbi:MAG: peptide chain release factor N(5)-glutamine methyltransferase [Deltaproteobacteria bacterium]|nr:peptide chain release factor N(5)-glutamine methyltransferase [Deltaproteobacteria bacterium]
MTESSEVWTILKVLDWTREWFQKKGLGSARLDAEVLLAHALGIPRVMLYARFDQPLKAEELDRVRALVQRRARGEPVAYLVGEKEFWSLPFFVTKDVLIPRPDTEVLVEVALELIRGVDEPRILDVGTGSGAIAIALARELSAAHVVAADRSPAALGVAEKNVERHRLKDRVTVVEADLLDGIEGTFDLVVANLPYIRTGELAGLMAEVRDFEPRDALEGGADGLEAIRRLTAAAPRVLSAGGWIALEAGHDQIRDLAEILEREAYAEIGTRRDYAGHPRVAWGRFTDRRAGGR